MSGGPSTRKMRCELSLAGLWNQSDPASGCGEHLWAAGVFRLVAQQTLELAAGVAERDCDPAAIDAELQRAHRLVAPAALEREPREESRAAGQSCFTERCPERSPSVRRAIVGSWSTRDGVVGRWRGAPSSSRALRSSARGWLLGGDHQLDRAPRVVAFLDGGVERASFRAAAVALPCPVHGVDRAGWVAPRGDARRDPRSTGRDVGAGEVGKLDPES